LKAGLKSGSAFVFVSDFHYFYGTNLFRIMELLLLGLAIAALLLGLLGAVLPILPGPPLSYLGIWLLKWSGYADFSPNFLITWAAITLIVTVLDYLLPMWMTKTFGGSKQATVGSFLGLVAGVFFFPPLGIILGPFVGAFVGELLDNSSSAKALKSAFGAFLAFIFGTGAKLAVSGVLIYYAIAAVVW
jgi:uncharacterized protein YqgC (DUF456 family)